MQTIDRYQLIDVLGTGAFATVWRAHDPVLDSEVALKVLADNWARDPEMRERFLSEARLALKATSPHLVRVYTVAEAAETNTPYIVMQLVDGGTLEDRIDHREAPLGRDDALATIRSIAVAVGALHDSGLLHRDLKPGNILYDGEGDDRPLLGDFGLARAVDRSALTMVAGTPAYAAPEQASGLTQLNEAADLYSLGIIFMELVTGEAPSHGSMAEAATNVIEPRRFLESHRVALDEPVLAWLDHLLDPEPEDRPQAASTVVAHVDSLLGTPSEPAAAVPPVPASKPHAEPSPVAATTAGTPPAEGVGAPSIPEDSSKNRGVMPMVFAACGLVVIAGLALFVLNQGDGNNNEGATATETGSDGAEDGTGTQEQGSASSMTTLDAPASADSAGSSSEAPTTQQQAAIDSTTTTSITPPTTEAAVVIEPQFAVADGVSMQDATSVDQLRELMEAQLGPTDDLAATAARLAPFPEVPRLSDTVVTGVTVNLLTNRRDDLAPNGFEQATRIDARTSALPAEVLATYMTAMGEAGFAMEQRTDVGDTTTVLKFDAPDGWIDLQVKDRQDGGSLFEVDYIVFSDTPRDELLASTIQWAGAGPWGEGLLNRVQVSALAVFDNYDVEVQHLFPETPLKEARDGLAARLETSDWALDEVFGGVQYVENGSLGRAKISAFSNNDDAIQVFTYEGSN